MLFEMFQQKFKKRKLREKKDQPSELSSPLWEVLNALLLSIMTTLDPSQTQRHHLAGGWSRLRRSLRLRTPNFTDSKHWQVWGKYLRRRGDWYLVQTDEVLGETELSLHCRPRLLSLQGSPADRSVPAGNIIDKTTDYSSPPVTPVTPVTPRKCSNCQVCIPSLLESIREFSSLATWGDSGLSTEQSHQSWKVEIIPLITLARKAQLHIVINSSNGIKFS